MENLELYLSENYIKEKELKTQVINMIEDSLKFYKTFDNKNGWSYEIEENNSKFSFSTTAMISFSLSILLGKDIDLIGCDLTNHDYTIKKDGNDDYEEILFNSIKLIYQNFSEMNEFTSNTYGINDPFTLTWVKCLVNEYKDILKINDEEINKIIDKKVEDVFKHFYDTKNEIQLSMLEKDGETIYPIDKNHMFPLLKVIHLSKLSKVRIDDIDKYNIKKLMENKLHYHLSLANISNSNFDAAELVFALEGLLLLDDNRENFDKNILNRVFEVIKERQEISLYWRPLKPFVTNKQGLALLPLSVEIAMSLIRICRLLGKNGERIFSKNIQLFKNYTDWLKSRIVKKNSNKTGEEVSYLGWCSEHIDSPNKIHTWETSQVLIYLTNFNDMLQKHISYQLFINSNFSIKELDHSEKKFKDFLNYEPINIHGYNIYESICNKYIKDNKDKSMLLYGPPGTGKSTIAEYIAFNLGYKLVTITPSNFIASGTENVESKTKTIFTVLEEQRDLVVLFDEIDRLIMDRDCKYYSEQGDMFQFMTPSMLVKIKDLRDKNNIIFIIATNYEERIDKAIKRAGRIDNKFLVLPPCKNTREKVLNNIDKKSVIPDNFKKCILNRTALYTYTELRKLIDEIMNSDIKNEEQLMEKISEPSISLLSYAEKIGIYDDEKVLQKPIKEFLSLVYLKCEVYYNGEKCYNVFTDLEIELLVKFFSSRFMLNFDLNPKDIKEFKKEIKSYEQSKLIDKINQSIKNNDISKIIAITLCDILESEI